MKQTKYVDHQSNNSNNNDEESVVKAILEKSSENSDYSQLMTKLTPAQQQIMNKALEGKRV